MIPYLVCRFEKSTLSNLVKECFGADFPDVFHKEQTDYIYRYTKDLGATSILLEFDYVDKDYLEDYSRYYVKCFSSNGYKCARLHFFAKDINHKYINDVLVSGNNSEQAKTLRDTYLGFMVIKPLPKTFIGKTCLKHYRDINIQGGIKRALKRSYNVDLFGINLHIESIAFQEQDKVVAACATTAIWSSLHATSWRSIREISACSEITTNAINHIDNSNNSFPNKELSNKQIMRALDIEGFRHHNELIAKMIKMDFFNSVRTHIDSNLPLILGVEVYGVSDENILTKKAGHAVTILGYKLSATKPAIYIHDDRLGPFVRASFVELKDFTYQSTADADNKHSWGLILQEKDDSGQWKKAHEVLLPDSLIVPTHKKVRLSSSFATNTCSLIVDEYEAMVRSLGEGKNIEENLNQVKFTIKLSEISAIRQEIINHSYNECDQEGLPLSKEELESLIKEKSAFLTGRYARFQWVASFSYKNVPAFKILFDATDIPQGNAISGIFIENKLESDVILSIVKEYAQAPESDKVINEPSKENFYKALLKYFKKPEPSLSTFLDETYGELRAPKFLTGDEVAGGRINNNDSGQCFYESIDKSLDDVFSDVVSDCIDSFKIWAIAHDGALLIGQEIGKQGHPSLTGFKPARIAGELRKISNEWVINSKSGRYSGDYSNANELLESALKKFRSLFYTSSANISAAYYYPLKV